ncbi:uncharacterized protein LOC114355438 [Ostrinia furnacalis]|uniref:uncharacterized protein LOC114355438 n=1 Tax=Ostrinia furnacalis TaxID=93504 RepID=UPI00103BE985|nr:uncharacterized protein LOC114355438 [Ostrinia furnacalis]
MTSRAMEPAGKGYQVIPSTLAYTVKVKGTIEIGDQIADILKEFKDRFVRQMEDLPSINNVKTVSVPVAENSDGMPQPRDVPFLNDIPIMENTPEKDVSVESIDVPLLDEIVSKKEGRVHIYGNHKNSKVRRPHEPLNNIVV